MLNVILALLELTVPSLDCMEIDATFVPFKFAVAVKVAASKAVLIADKVPAIVKLAVPLPKPPKVIPEVPVVIVPPVIATVTVWSSPSVSVTPMLSAKDRLILSSLTKGIVGAVTTGAEFDIGLPNVKASIAK